MPKASLTKILALNYPKLPFQYSLSFNGNPSFKRKEKKEMLMKCDFVCIQIFEKTESGKWKYDY